MATNDTPISPREVARRAQAYIDSFETLKAANWRFRFNRGKCRIGLCRFGRKLIEVSTHLLTNEWAMVEDILKHEVAHALVGPGHHHDHVWVAQARAIGCTAMRCGPEGIDIPATFRGICPSCPKEYKAHRMPRRDKYCRPCLRQAGIFDSRSRLKWVPSTP